jgi:hypothetical protein
VEYVVRIVHMYIDRYIHVIRRVVSCRRVEWNESGVEWWSAVEWLAVVSGCGSLAPPQSKRSLVAPRLSSSQKRAREQPSPFPSPPKL